MKCETSIRSSSGWMQTTQPGISLQDLYGAQVCYNRRCVAKRLDSMTTAKLGIASHSDARIAQFQAGRKQHFYHH